MEGAGVEGAGVEGAGVEDAAVSNDCPIGVVAREVMAFMGWPSAPITP